MKNNILSSVITLFAMFISMQCIAQFDHSSNCYNCSDLNNTYHPAPAIPGLDLSSMTGVPCNANTFYSLTTAGTIEELQINGSTVTSNGTITTCTGYSLVYCNNLNGGAYSPTLYSHAGSTSGFEYFDGTGWVLTSSPALQFPGGSGGYGGQLYSVYGDSIVQYDGVSFNTMYHANPQVFTIADLAVDNSGNIWCIQGNVWPMATAIVVISPAGQLLKQYSFSLNTSSCYGCFLLNGIMYLGFGSNPVYPNSLLPISFTANAATMGSPISMSNQYVRDLASCSPGLPMSVAESEQGNNFTLYPVPAHNELHLSVAFQGLSEYIIYNVDGKPLTDKIQLSGNTDIDISSLPAGVYLIEILSEEKTLRSKFIKM